MQIIKAGDQDFLNKFSTLINSEAQSLEKISQDVVKIISDVKKRGDDALIEMSNKFDGANFSSAPDLLVDEEEIDRAIKNIKPEILAALNKAYANILTYSQKQLPQDFFFDDSNKNRLGNIWRPIEKVAIYVPGGTAFYPSSVLMNAVPAIAAGVAEIVMVTPSNGGKISPIVLAAAKICGIKKIYKIGGAGAVAAMAYGTKTITKVDKIVGPGNSFVALAKKQVFGDVGIDMIAGPTDILVIADSSNNSDWIAADLLSQAEHGVDSKAILISDDEDFVRQVSFSIEKLNKNLSRREISQKSLAKSAIILVDDLSKEAPEITNKIAPEHLEISLKNKVDQEEILKKISHAGAVFLGKYSPEAIGDYIAGPSHTLPTGGSARFSSGLSVFDFLKRVSVISCSESGFFAWQKDAAIIASEEGLDAHKLSLDIRD